MHCVYGIFCAEDKNFIVLRDSSSISDLSPTLNDLSPTLNGLQMLTLHTIPTLLPNFLLMFDLRHRFLGAVAKMECLQALKHN